MVLPDVTTGKLDEGWGIFLKNEGVGPAEINYNAVTLDGRRISILDVVPQMIKEGIVSPDSNFSVLDLNAGGSSLKEGAKKTILVIDPKSVVQFAKFDAFIHCRINICYQSCSLYDECEDSCTAKQCVSRQ